MLEWGMWDIMVDFEFIKYKLDYDPKTGIFVWKNVHKKAQVKVGDPLKSKLNGYLIVKLNKKIYYLHRIAVLWMTGSFPEFPMEVDHINGIKTDNRWENLRVVTVANNQHNQYKHRKRNDVGVRKNKNRWRADIGINGKVMSLGSYISKEEAIIARKKAEKLYWKKDG